MNIRDRILNCCDYCGESEAYIDLQYDDKEGIYICTNCKDKMIEGPTEIGKE